MTLELINAMVKECTNEDLAHLLNVASTELVMRNSRLKEKRSKSRRELNLIIKTLKEEGKIMAIKVHRSMQPESLRSLKESKDYVEHIIDKHNVQVHMPSGTW